MATTSSRIRDNVHDTLLRLGYISSEKRRRQHDSANDPLLKFVIEDQETDSLIRNHILGTVLQLWLCLDSFHGSMEAAEQTLKLIDTMYKEPSYCRNLTEVDLERIEQARDIIVQWRKANPPEEVVVEVIHLRKDPYEVLGVQRDATTEQVKEAYRRLAKELHPDLHGNSKESNERFREIQEAYDALCGPNPYI
jgi:hypothetical protein